MNKQKHTEYKNAIPNWEEGIILVENKTGKYRFEFLNRSFENIMGKSFSNATKFKNGFASIVEDKSWTIIDKKGNQKSYPNYNPIENLSLNIFKTTEKINLGVVDSNSKIIIPIEFEKINFINQNIIQGIKEGKLFYFDYQGKIIYE